MRYLFSSGTVWVCIAFTIGLCTTGCTSFREELLRSGDSAPAWTQGKVQTALPDSSADVFFVGRSVGYNVLDEAAAVSAAREDVFRQVAQMITTRVTTQGESSDSRWDSESDFEFKDMRYLPGGELQQQIHREAMQFTAGLAGELIDRDVHLEQWEVRKKKWVLLTPVKSGAVRYKCWLLMSIPEAKLQARINEFRQQIKAAYDRYLEDRARAIAWAQQDRDRRIQRENKKLAWLRQDQVADRKEARAIRSAFQRDLTGVRYAVKGNH